MRPDLTSDQTMPAEASILWTSQSWRMWGAMWEFCRATACPGRSQPTSNLMPAGVPPPTGAPGQWLYNNHLLAPVRCPLSFMLSSIHFQCLLPYFRVGCLLVICKEREEAAGSCLWDLNPKGSGVVSTSRVFWLWLEMIALEFDSREKEIKVLPPPYRFDPVRRVGYCPIIQWLGRCLKLERY